jgi:hypothetical protein
MREHRTGKPIALEIGTPRRVSGTQIHPSCCSGVFVNQSSESGRVGGACLAGLDRRGVGQALVLVVSARALDAAYGCCREMRLRAWSVCVVWSLS